MAAVKKFWNACENGPAACTTAWDFPTARLCEAAGVDLILIGDSLGLHSLGLSGGFETTIEELISRARAVSRGAKTPFRLGDLPQGTYEVSPEQAVASALRLVKEGLVHGVKLEGGKEMAPQVAAITRAGVPVIGHIGLTPQRAIGTLHEDIPGRDDPSANLSFGSTVSSAEQVLEDALAIQDAGAVGIVVEAVADQAMGLVTDMLKIPTIGIGSGPRCKAQMTLQTEVLGYLGNYLHKWHVHYGTVGQDSVTALKKYKDEVRTRKFPTLVNTYDMVKGEGDKLEGLRQKVLTERERTASQPKSKI